MIPQEIAGACLANEIGPLQAAARLLSSYKSLFQDPIWEATGGAHGTLSALYAASDEIDRLGIIDPDPEWWHPDVRDAKRIELEESQRRWEGPVKAACRAILEHAAATSTTFRCPCCRHATLAERGGDEICPVCFWQDDGQEDHDADQVRGGPNGLLSLTEARRNFVEYGSCDRSRKSFARPPQDDDCQ